MTPTTTRRTGGQINVAGILYQLLVSLAEGLESTVTQCAIETDGTTVVLHVEPYDGGDVQITVRERRVIQIKMKSRHLHWTLGEIISKVLPDLFRAARKVATDRFQFVTDNDSGCDEFRRFLQWVRDRAGLGNGASAGPPQTFKHGRGNQEKRGEEILSAIAEALKLEGAADPRLLPFLVSLEVLRLDRQDLLTTINRHLGTLVEATEDVRHKRKQLIGELVDLGSSGTKITTSELLQQAGLDPRRFVHASLLPRRLRAELTKSFKTLKYDPVEDVRSPLPAPQRPVTVLRGESGLGKTWRLCATARAMSDAGKPVIILRASTNLDALQRRIATTIWNPVYTNEAPLPSVAHRLAPKLADERGVWLTVFLDDLNDPMLARQIVDARWSDLGIDLVLSSQPATADWLRAEIAPEIHEVPAFSFRELVTYLESHDVRVADVQPDVFELLLKPVLAKLYCMLPHGLIFSTETEYQLMERFWEHAAKERASHVFHPFDLDRLQLLVGDMLAGPTNYPWPPSTFLRVLDDATIERLTESGLLELDGDRRLSMTHDRLLNWAMAEHLAAAARDRNLDEAELLHLIRQTKGLTTIGGVNIGGRLGYVLMDLLWLLLGAGRWTPSKVASFLLAYMRHPDFDAYNRDFFQRLLATLGLRAVPLFRAMVELGLDGEREFLWPNWIADAFRRVADVAWDQVQDAAVALFRSGGETSVEVGLRVLKKTGSADLLSELFELNMVRTAARDAATPEDMSELIDAKSRAFDAFAASVALDIPWFEAKIISTSQSAEAEQLLWALTQLPRSTALPLWRSHRDRFFELISEGRRVLPKAVRTFADPVDLPRLRLPSPVGAEKLHGAATFDAIARLDPQLAIQILGADRSTENEIDLIGTDRWWMPGLHYRTGAALGEALTERSLRLEPKRPAGRLAQHYSGQPEIINLETVDLLLDELETIVSAADVPLEERQRQSYRLLETLSSMRTVATMERIASRRGSRLEAGLTELGIGRPQNNSRVVDRELEMISSLLALMAGEGFDRLVVAELASPGVTTREYGYGHALWTESTEVGDVLEDHVANWEAGDQDRPYYLMQALAAHGRDAGLIRLIEGSSPVYTNAVDIRHARRGDTSALIAVIREKIASEDAHAQIEAVDLSHFVGDDESLSLTMPLITRCAPGDSLASRLLMLHLHRRRYEPALLPKLKPFLASPDDNGPIAALHLALHGDAEGRAASVEWLAGPGGSTQWRAIQTAMALLEHGDSKEGAMSFLRGLPKKRLHYGRLDSDVLEKLAQHGDPGAREHLLSLAFGSGTRDVDAVAGAVRAVAKEDPHGAFQAARRLFANSKQFGSALTLMAVDPHRGTEELLNAYFGAKLPMKMAIARTLRLKADPQVLVPVLEGMANAAGEDERRVAAEVAGWLSHREKIPLIGRLVNDPVQAVEEAALLAAHRRAAGVAGEELLRLIPHQAKPAQWAMMRALINLVDPHLLADRDDVLAIHHLLDQLPDEFRIEAKQWMDQRIKNIDRDIDWQARSDE